MKTILFTLLFIGAFFSLESIQAINYDLGDNLSDNALTHDIVSAYSRWEYNMDYIPPIYYYMLKRRGATFSPQSDIPLSIISSDVLCSYSPDQDGSLGVFRVLIIDSKKMVMREVIAISQDIENLEFAYYARSVDPEDRGWAYRTSLNRVISNGRVKKIEIFGDGLIFSDERWTNTSYKEVNHFAVLEKDFLVRIDQDVRAAQLELTDVFFSCEKVADSREMNVPEGIALIVKDIYEEARTWLY